MGIPATIAAIIVMGTAAALFRFLRPGPAFGSRLGSGAGPGSADLAGWRLGPPWLSLAVVIALIYLNQVLFTVYVLRVHQGDPAFIARYLPAGWFAMAGGRAVSAFARWFPFPSLLAPSVLRVQAFLELPFVTFGYLTVCRWFSLRTYQAAVRMAWPLSACATATFCLVEWSLRNPYTADDIVIRIAAGIAVPLWVRRLSDAAAAVRPEGSAGAGKAPEVPEVPGLAGMLVFVVSTLALGMVILTVYQTALLYDLGQLPGLLPLSGAALAVLALARLAARVLPHRPPGAGVEFVSSSLGAFLVLFAVPALPVRYALQERETRYVAAAATAVVVGVALWSSARQTLDRDGVRTARWLRQMTAAAIAGVLAGLAGYALSRELVHGRLSQGDGSELPPVLAAAAFFLCTACACALMDARTPRGASPPAPRLPVL